MGVGGPESDPQKGKRHSSGELGPLLKKFGKVFVAHGTYKGHRPKAI